MDKRLFLVPMLMLAVVPAFGASKVPPKHAVAAHKPDAALLEFLGTWESKDGRWVDPMTFARIDPDKTVRDQARRQGKLPLDTGKTANKTSGGGGSGV